MGHDKTKLIHLFNFVKDIYKDPDNKDFAAWVQSLVLDGSDIKQDINEIRKALGLRGKQSIDYSFVNEESVRLQLCVDNLRMENAMLNLTISDADRLTTFYTNAHMQAEGLLNYYYSMKFNFDVNAIIQNIQNSTAKSGYFDKEKQWQSKAITINSEPGKEPKSAESLSYYAKLFAFFEAYKVSNPGLKGIDSTYSNLDSLRKLRNDAFHRGMPINDDSGKKPYYPDYHVIRKDLQLFVELIKENL